MDKIATEAARPTEAGRYRCPACGDRTDDFRLAVAHQIRTSHTFKPAAPKAN